MIWVHVVGDEGEDKEKDKEAEEEEEEEEKYSELLLVALVNHLIKAKTTL